MADITSPSWPFKVKISCPVLVSQTMVVLSSIAVTTRFPSGCQSTELTRFLCPKSIANSWPVWLSHILVNLSQLAVAILWPSGLHLADQISS